MLCCPDDPKFVYFLLLLIARAFYLVAVSSKSTLRALSLSGVDGGVHIPFACDPAIHRDTKVEKEFDVTFVGSYYPERATILSELRHEVKIWGPYWNLPWLSAKVKRRVTSGDSRGRDYIEIMNK